MLNEIDRVTHLKSPLTVLVEWKTVVFFFIFDTLIFFVTFDTIENYILILSIFILPLLSYGFEKSDLVSAF